MKTRTVTLYPFLDLFNTNEKCDSGTNLTKKEDIGIIVVKMGMYNMIQRMEIRMEADL
ncbi:hypothetical protein [Jeotgalibacillus sp. S-D1]|uniref:hypothetical protein n=1 Tax=Jeotgalibacillus sp. S-D1 TaxID=2552189 RepID=UPI001404E622|nr:hypothetical protein [Jeotgalibacillus sp. S-D1]